MRLLYRRYAIPICVFLYFPTLVSGESIARGSPLREIGQKPEPTIAEAKGTRFIFRA